MSAPARTFTVRNIQLLRALFAAAAALMITFSPDHSAAVGFAVFGGFVAASGFIFVLGAWLTAPAGSRWPYILLGAIDLLVAVVSGIPTWRTEAAFFIVVIIWAAATGLVELIAGLRARRTDATAKDAITVGALGLLLAVVLLVIPAGYTLQYSVDGAGALTLTGIILAVGMVGGYTAVVAVFLAIAGFSPNRAAPANDSTTKDADTDDATSAPVETEGSRVSDKKTNRRELLRPLHLLGIALVCGVFAAIVTLVSTGAFTSRVNVAIANGTYHGLTPVALGLVIGGGAFIVTLLIMSMLILAVDPREYEEKTLDRPVLYDEEPGDQPSSDASGSDSSTA